VEDELEVIRSRMEETRSSLADKIDALENQVIGTVESATSSVANTVETVKDKVEDTVETVKDAFNLRKHVENHPWLALSGSIATGYLAGCLLPGSREPEPVSFEERPPRSYAHEATHPNGHNGHAEKETEDEDEGGLLQDGLKMIQGLAVGTMMSLIRDLVTRTAPSSLVEDMTGLVNNVTDRLGGKRLWENQDEADTTDQDTSTGVATHAEHKSSEMGRSMGTTRW